jgi:nitrogen fixation protein FixH
MNLRMPSVAASGGGRGLTGGMVLAMLLGFFGLVMAVNLVMVHAAVSSFGGVETPSSYQAGLNFPAEQAAVAAQDARGWKVEVRVGAGTDAARTVTVTATDAGGHPLAGLAVSAAFAHPVDERRDVAVALAETGAGSYAGSATVVPGQWTLDLAISKDGARLFHSLNRIMVR